MTILNRMHLDESELVSGIDCYLHVDERFGSESLSVSSLEFRPEATVLPHVHPTEEAMVVLEGVLEAVLDGETVTVSEGQTVFGPAGVSHGFVNRSSEQAKLMAIFPTGSVEYTVVN